LIKIFCRLGFPKGILMDGGKEFTAKEVTKILEIASVQRNVTAPYHHSANGLAESSVKVLTTSLKKMLEEEKRENWADYLPFIQFYMNNRILELTGSTPFSLLFGRSSSKFQDYSNVETSLLTEKQLKERWDYMAKVIYPNIEDRVTERNVLAQKRFKENHLIHKFKVGDQCMYLRKEYADQYAVVNKWEPVYEGPMQITRIRGENYQGVDLQTELETRWLPASHLKLFAKVAFIVEKKRSTESGSTWKYLVELTNEQRVWVSEECVSQANIREFKERRLLEEGEEAVLTKKRKGITSLELQIQRLQEKLAQAKK